MLDNEDRLILTDLKTFTSVCLDMDELDELMALLMDCIARENDLEIESLKNDR